MLRVDSPREPIPLDFSFGCIFRRHPRLSGISRRRLLRSPSAVVIALTISHYVRLRHPYVKYCQRVRANIRKVEREVMKEKKNDDIRCFFLPLLPIPFLFLSYESAISDVHRSAFNDQEKEEKILPRERNSIEAEVRSFHTPQIKKKIDIL